MTLYEELKRRGFIYQETDTAAIERKINGEKTVFYCGFDPTGSSLHVGHLLPVMAMMLLQRAGHIPVALVGGATGQIGDPSGRSTARNMLTGATVADNVLKLKNQLGQFLVLDDRAGHFADNLDWLGNLGLLDFLREVGSRFSVNKMLAQKSVESRLVNGLSFLEFTYSLLQAYDFWHLKETFGCTLEIGGQDQWGNMVAGTELIRKLDGESSDVQCMTIPLLMNPATGQKFGKSIGGTSVWLDPERTSDFDYYQFWRNCDDAMLPDLLRKFAIDLPLAECDALANIPNINRAKEILAFEATKLARGEAAAANAYRSAGANFGFADPERKVPTSSAVAQLACETVEIQLPQIEISTALLSEHGLWIIKALTESKLCDSNSAARRLLQSQAVKIDGTLCGDPDFEISRTALANGVVLQCGKKNFRRLILL